jgi:hypothetical protein
MGIHTIATILMFVCFGIAFICWSWLNIEATRRHRRQKALEQDPIPQVNRFLLESAEGQRR